MERRPSGYPVRAVLALLAIAALLAPLFVLRGLPHASLAASGIGWVVPMLAAGLLAAAAVAAVASLSAGLRYGILSGLLLSGGSAALVGASVATIGGTGTVGLPVLTAAALMLSASFAERLGSLVAGRRARIVTAAVLLVVAETVVVGEVLPPVAQAIQPYVPFLLAAAAVVAGLAAIVIATHDLAPAAAATAVGASALALARGDGAEVAFGLVALTAAALLTARSVIGTERATNEIDGEPLPALASQLSEGVLRFDGHLALRSWNPAAAAMLGLDEDSTGARLEDLLGVTLQQLPATTETVLHRMPIGALDMSIHRDASAITVVIHDPGTATDAERLGRELRGTIEELIQTRRTLELQRAEIERAATVDPLTGVGSRIAILERLHIEVEQARRYQHPVAVVLLDVDSFGEINTAHGIEGGDAVLREIALRVRLRVRAADAIGRSGSDGLLAILPHTDESGAATFADALRRRIGQRPVSIGDIEVGVTLSIGVAVMRAGEELDVDALMARAEEALGSARVAGGNRIALDRLHGLARLEEKPGSVRDRLSIAEDEALDEGA